MRKLPTSEPELVYPDRNVDVYAKVVMVLRQGKRCNVVQTIYVKVVDMDLDMMVDGAPCVLSLNGVIVPEDTKL